MRHRVITIVGGTGFLGRYVVKHLAAAGYTLRIICRNPDGALHLKTAGDVGQIVLLSGNIAKPDTLKGKLDGSFAVINLVGLLFESGSQNFTDVHAKGAEKLALMAKEAGALRFVQVSALGVDKASDSKYAYTKAVGERAVAAAFPEATILRPSVMFGPEDNFFNQFAAMESNPLIPFIPLVGGGQNKFQPVYVDDVATAIEACLVRSDVLGETFELGGPRSYSFREIIEYIVETVSKRKADILTGGQFLAYCAFLAVPFFIHKMLRGKVIATMPAGFASLLAVGMEAAYRLLPFARAPKLTRDQVRLLKYDNVVSPGAKSFMHMGINPSAVEVVVPSYLARFSKKGGA